MDGVSLGARFSLVTNRKRYCGPADAEPALYRAAADGTDLDRAASALARFEALYPYLETIAAATGHRPFDKEVVEAYWVGNELLDGLGAAEFRTILRRLAERGLPAFVARELAERLPPRPVPHHMFHVAFVGVGAVTGHVATTIPNMEACRPAAATVTSVEADRLALVGPGLELRDGRVVLGSDVPSSASYDPRLLPGVGAGSCIARHWGWAALELDDRQRANLERYTALALEQANEGHANARTDPGPAAPGHGVLRR